MGMPNLEQIAPFLKMPLEVQVELGRRLLPLREIANLEAGGVIAFDTAAGENLAVFIGGVRIGSGEVLNRRGAMAVRLDAIGNGRRD
jgi:flagellar motor switch protein FliN